MFKKILFLLLLPFFCFANTPYHTIKLAVYRDLPTLQKEIGTLSPKLQQQVKIEQINGLYKASVIPRENKKALQEILPHYKKVFHDAFITTASAPKITKTIVKNNPKSPTIQKTKPIQPTSFYNKIKNRTLYLCTYGKTTNWKKILFKTTFTKDRVSYHPLIGKTPPIKAEYRILHDKLYLFQKKMFNPRVYSRLAYETPKYYAVSSWIDNRRINTIRYYFNEKDARSYLNAVK
jgi:hypothetical protein